jgi:predicted dehydrogenase
VCVPPALHETVTVTALRKGVHVIVEKPFTGAFGPPNEPGFRGNAAPKEPMRAAALSSARRMLDAEAASTARIYYAENWVFAPVVQKEVEIIAKTKAQLLWVIAEESHSGSHAPAYGTWRLSGGGSLMGKGTHPLTTVLHLKRTEGMARSAAPIRPATVTARVHEITRLAGYEDKGHLRTSYIDVEDFGLMHLTFADGTVADVFSSELVMGGVHNWLEVFANNHRTRCNINPMDGLETYNPVDEQLADVYVVEKTGTKQGWSKPAPDEHWMNGYVQELAEFYRCMAEGRASFAGGQLGYDTVAVLYSAYLSAERGGQEVEVPRE